MTTVALLGFHVRTAPIAIRERLAQLQHSTSDIHQHIPGTTSVILQTCNRFELYCAHQYHRFSQAELIQYLTTIYAIDANLLAAHCYWYTDEHASRHIMRVACGLDSITLGEAQILGQIRSCMHHLQAQQPLHRLFLLALKAGRRARQHTDIGRHTTSISHTAVELLLQQHPAYPPRVLVLGAGEMGTLAVGALHKLGVPVSIGNRSPQPAHDLAVRFGASIVPWESRHQALVHHSAVIVATAADTPILCAESLSCITIPSTHQCTIIDIGMPRNVAPALANLSWVNLYSIDDLQHVIDAHHALREQAIPAVEHIIAQHLTQWYAWQTQQMAKTDIVNLRDWGSELYATELKRALRKLDRYPQNSHRILQEFGHRLTQKLLHPNTIALRKAATQQHTIPSRTTCDRNTR